MYWNHDLDLSESRNVIGHVTIPFAIGHILFASSDSFCGKTHRLATMHNVTDDNGHN